MCNYQQYQQLKQIFAKSCAPFLLVVTGKIGKNFECNGLSICNYEQNKFFIFSFFFEEINDIMIIICSAGMTFSDGVGRLKNGVYNIQI